jgi:hypothetical protein
MDQLEFLRQVIGILHGSGLRYMVVGSFASGFWGEPRATFDVDVVISLEASDLAKLITLFPPDQFYLSAEAAQDAIQRKSQFNIIHPDSGNKIDMMIQGADAWGQLQLARRRLLVVEPGFELYVATPEDIILSKLRNAELDKAYLNHWASMLQIEHEWATAQTWGR